MNNNGDIDGILFFIVAIKLFVTVRQHNFKRKTWLNANESKWET